VRVKNLNVGGVAARRVQRAIVVRAAFIEVGGVRPVGGTEVGLHNVLANRDAVVRPAGAGKIVTIVFLRFGQVGQVLLFEIGEQQVEDTRFAIAPGAVPDPVRHGGESLVVVVVVVDSQSELFEIIAALHACRRFADLLDGGQQQADEDGDDGDHHQQL